MPTPGMRLTSGFHALAKLARYAKPYQWRLVSAVFLLLLTTCLQILFTWLMKVVLDEHIVPGVQDIKAMITLGFTLFGILLFWVVLQYIQNVCFQYCALDIVHDLRRTLFVHILTLPISYFDSKSTGHLVSRTTSDSEVLRQMFMTVMPVMLQASFRIAGIFVAMALLNVYLMLLGLLLIPVILVGIYLYQKVSHPLIHGIRHQLANISSRMNESLNGIRIIQAMGQEASLQQQFDQDNKEWHSLVCRNVGIESLLLMPFTSLLGNISLVVVVGWFGYQSFFSQVEAGTVYAFISYLEYFFLSIAQITLNASYLQQSLVASERLFEVFDFAREAGRKENRHHDVKVDAGIRKGKLEFKKVIFSYDDFFNESLCDSSWAKGRKRTTMVLDNVSFVVESGQFVAIVGHSGSGKSSIINLLMGFYQHQYGQILIDDQPISSLAEDTLRKGVGLVFQEPYIFSGSMADNISLNLHGITQPHVQEAARQVFAEPFIEKLEGGYLHNPGAGGTALSIGERQLLSFARTVAHNPKVLLLDEATANIDGETEYAIREALITLRKNRTIIMVAHRLTTIENADQILVMEKGRIVQQGRHQQLVQSEGHYRDMYVAQQTHG